MANCPSTSDKKGEPREGQTRQKTQEDINEKICRNKIREALQIFLVNKYFFSSYRFYLQVFKMFSQIFAMFYSRGFKLCGKCGSMYVKLNKHKKYEFIAK